MMPDGFFHHIVRRVLWRFWARPRQEWTRSRAEATGGSRPIAHFAFDVSPNIGDVVLSQAVRATINSRIACDWQPHAIRAPVGLETIKTLNRTTRGIVVGGGGAFLSDTNPNQISGWQWAISPDLIRRIEVPLALYALGYNRFRGQERFSQIFVDSITVLAEKSVFIGLRNSGSIRAVKSYLPETLWHKLSYQPCPTTVLFYLALSHRDLRRPGARLLVLNAAFDRTGNRFQGDDDRILGVIADQMHRAARAGWDIVLACHSPGDERIHPYLAARNVRHRVAHLWLHPAERTLSLYAAADLVIGMRGHAQMIPFGLGTPVLSLVAHDKLSWFLDDIGHPEWGVDVTHADFDARLAATWAHIVSDLEKRRSEVAEARARLWQVTQDNLVLLGSRFVAK